MRCWKIGRKKLEVPRGEPQSRSLKALPRSSPTKRRLSTAIVLAGVVMGMPAGEKRAQGPPPGPWFMAYAVIFQPPKADVNLVARG